MKMINQTADSYKTIKSYRCFLAEPEIATKFYYFLPNCKLKQLTGHLEQLAELSCDLVSKLQNGEFLKGKNI